MILGGQAPRQQADRGDRQLSCGELLQSLREQPTRSRRVDPVVRGILRQTEDVVAVREERRVTRAPVELSRVELREMREEARSRAPFVVRTARDFCNQCGV